MARAKHCTLGAVALLPSECESKIDCFATCPDRGELKGAAPRVLQLLSVIAKPQTIKETKKEAVVANVHVRICIDRALKNHKGLQTRSWAHGLFRVII